MLTITADSHAAADRAWRLLTAADLPQEGAVLHTPDQTVRLSRDDSGRLVLERLG